MRLANLKGVSTVLDDLGAKAASDDHNPLTNRQLIIEPAMLSQRLRVPKATVEAVVKELTVFNLAHVWVRAICPADAEDGGVIVETDDRQVFAEMLRRPCDHCGLYHENLGWSDIQTFYAIHLDGQRGRFKLRRLFRQSPAMTQSAAVQPKAKGCCTRIWNWARSFFASGARKPEPKSATELANEKLAFNQPNVSVPTGNDLTVTVLKLVGAWTVSTLTVFMLCRYLCDIITTVVALVILFSGGGAGAWFYLRAIYAGSAVPRSLLAGAYVASGALYSASIVDFDVKWEQSKPIAGNLSSGRIEPTLAICATIVIVVAHICVVLYHSMRRAQ
jgi:hypothetical protein